MTTPVFTCVFGASVVQPCWDLGMSTENVIVALAGMWKVRPDSLTSR